MDKIIRFFFLSLNKAENHVFEVKIQRLQNLHIYNVIIPTKFGKDQISDKSGSLNIKVTICDL